MVVGCRTRVGKTERENDDERGDRIVGCFCRATCPVNRPHAGPPASSSLFQVHVPYLRWRFDIQEVWLACTFADGVLTGCDGKKRDTKLCSVVARLRTNFKFT